MNTGYEPPNAKDAKDSQSARKEQPNFEVDCSHAIIGAAVEVQRILGVGLLESAYAGALAVELAERGLGFSRDVPIVGSYKGTNLGTLYRADFVVADSVIVEIKAGDSDAEADRARLLSCLKLSGHKIGLLINFHTFPVVKGVHRLVNKP